MINPKTSNTRMIEYKVYD